MHNIMMAVNYWYLHQIPPLRVKNELIFKLEYSFFSESQEIFFDRGHDPFYPIFALIYKKIKKIINFIQKFGSSLSPNYIVIVKYKYLCFINN